MRCARAACLAAVLSRFPIPMRGNEWIKRQAARDVHFRFPIPMRGNELTSSSIMKQVVNGVSDPHEG